MTSSGNQEPDEQYEIIDFGGHLYSDRVPFRPAGFDEYQDIIPFFSDVETMIEMYKAAGITGAVVVAPQYSQCGTQRTAKANDILLEIIEENDHYIGGLACIPFVEDGTAAAAELERCLDNGFNGAVIETRNDDGLELIDECLEPVYDVAEETGAPIMVHPRTESPMLPGRQELEVFESDYRFDNIFGHQVELWTSMCKVVHDGVLDCHPDLKLVYDHVGGNIGSMMGRISYQYMEDRWPSRENERFKHWEEFKPQLEQLYIKMSGYNAYRAPLRAALEEFSPSHVLFGTDFPFECRSVEELEEQIKHVEELNSITECQNIFSGNVRELLINL